MGSLERKTIYRQGFRASEPVVDALNSFLKTPRSSFTLYSNAEYAHIPLEALRYDDQANMTVAERVRDINDTVDELSAYSKNLGAKIIHLSLPAGSADEERGLLLRFSPLVQEAGTYWKIIEKLRHQDERPTPSEIVALTRRDIYVGLPKDGLLPKASLKLAKQTLAYMLNDPDQKYTFGIESISGLMKSQLDLRPPKKGAEEIDHPDILNEA